jgi:hypothetical protein
MTTFKLSDNVICHIVQLLQEALLTGTDVSDHFRMIRLADLHPDEDGSTLTLDLDADYSKLHDGNVRRMVEEAAEFQKLQNSVIDDPKKLH